MFALLFGFGDLLLQRFDLFLVLIVISDELQSFSLLALDPEQGLLLVLQDLEVLLQIFEFVLLALHAATVVDVFKLPLGEEDLVLEVHNLNLLLLELGLLGLHGLVVLGLLCVQPVFL